MLSRTRDVVSAEIDRLPVRTYETVLGATPACRATSAIVTTPVNVVNAHIAVQERVSLWLQPVFIWEVT